MCLRLPTLLGAGAATAQDCNPVPGVERLWAKPETRFVILGEMHGTAETPVLFADVVCRVAATGRPVPVGIEFPEDEQPAMDRFMQTEGTAYPAPARVHHDGRRSEAMLELLNRLRAIRTSRRNVEVFTFVRNSTRGPGESQTPHELAMASAWRDQAIAHPGALMVILVGNVHAMKQRPADVPFTPAAALLPPESTVALGTSQPGGAIWACGASDCGPRSTLASGDALPRGIHLGDGIGIYDGVFSVGAPFTPSGPASLRPR